jgi:F0F1-type ATP synthase assembly protein I
MSDSNDDWMKNYGRYSSIAFQMIVIVLGGVFLGYKIDIWIHSNKHIFLIIFSLLSGFLALYLAFRDLLKFK